MAVLAAGTFGSVLAQSGIILSDKAGWHKIAEKTVGFSRDRDQIAVIGADRFAAIKLKVKKAGIRLNQMELTFESGDAQLVKLEDNIQREGETKVIDIKGSERDLKSIAFTYSTLPNTKEKKATVEVWGLKTNADENKTGSVNQSVNSSGVAVGDKPKTDGTSTITGTMNPEQSKFGNLDTSRVPASPAIVWSDKTGWHKIAERTVDFSTDRDEILVTGANRFASVRFKATDAPIMLMTVRLQYDKGDSQEVAFNQQVDTGKETPEIKLDKGHERDLKRVFFFYKTVPNFKDKKATIEVWGFKSNGDQSMK